LAKERLKFLDAHIPTDMERRSRMNAKRLVILVALLAGWCLIVGLGPVSAQQAPPTEHKGVKAEVLTTIDLGSEIEGMQGRQQFPLIALQPLSAIPLGRSGDGLRVHLWDTPVV
jgi:hypothetical protein